MTPKIPSSLKWLIDKRARLDAEIAKTRASLSNAKKLVKELAELERDLAAIDRSLGMHEIQVDLENIAPIRSHYVRINLPRGELTKAIYQYLRLRNGGPASMTEITAFIENKYRHLIDTPMNRMRLHNSVHNRLKSLYREGKLHRHHEWHSNRAGVWSLAFP
jgi:hypothetical protein